MLSAEAARFLAAFCGVGASPDTGITVMVPQIVGRRRAREIIQLNGILDVQTAYQDRIVTQICPSDDVLKIDNYPDADFACIYGYEENVDPTCVKSRTGYVITVAD